MLALHKLGTKPVKVDFADVKLLLLVLIINSHFNGIADDVVDALHQHRIIGMDDTFVHHFIDRADGVSGFTIIFQLIMLHIFEQPE